MQARFLTILIMASILSAVSLAAEMAQYRAGTIPVAPVSFTPEEVRKIDSELQGDAEDAEPVADIYSEESKKFKSGGWLAPPINTLLAPTQIDPGVAGASGGGQPTPPSLLYSFRGISDADGNPADCTIAASPTELGVATNGVLAFYSKTNGDLLFQSNLRSWFFNVLPNASVFDPKLIYDQEAGRYVLSAAGTRMGESWVLISVSSGADWRGTWRSYRLDATLNGDVQTPYWADQPALSIDSEAVYLAMNMFDVITYKYAKIRIIDKSVLYRGGQVTWKDLYDLHNPDEEQTIAKFLRAVRNIDDPPAQYFMNSASPFWDSKLTLWSVTNPLNSKGPTLTRRSIDVDPYFLPPEAQQRDMFVRIETSDARLWDAVYSNGSIWTSHTIAVSWGELLIRSGIRWYQIDAASAQLIQEGTYGAPGYYYYFSAILPDSNGNVAVVFNRSSDDRITPGRAEFVSTYFTGRLADDPEGQLARAVELRVGTAFYVRPDALGINRWGDYNGITLDPDGTTIWIHGSYVPRENTWGTYIGGLIF